MEKKPVVISIIPARGGSKGIPQKNLLDFCGKPLVAWSIIQAAKTPEIDRVFVTSDSDEILGISKRYGAEVIKRPDDISGDTASSESAVEHVLRSIDAPRNAIVVLVQPTSPLRKPDDLGKAVRRFSEENWDSAFSGAVLEDFLIWEKDSDGIPRSLNYDYRNRGRRQDRKPQYVENGSFYLFTPEVLYSGNRLGGRIGIIPMEFWQSFEIDTMADVELVSTLFGLKIRYLYKDNTAI